MCLVCAQVSKSIFPGFDVYDVPMDGNCLFSPISHQLCALEIDVVERSAHDIRTELVNVLENDSQLVARVAQGLAKGLKCKFTTVFTRVGMMVLYF